MLFSPKRNFAFILGLDRFGKNCSDLLIAIKYFFKDRPSRWEDFENLQKKHNLPTHVFIKHVSSRWLTMEPAAKRLLEQWPAVIEYFQSYIPRKENALTKTQSYKNIMTFLKNPTIKLEVMLASESATMFSRFTGLFQKNEPLIHILYDEILILIVTILSKFCKISNSQVLLADDFDLNHFFKTQGLPLSEVYVSSDIKKEMHKIFKNESDQLVFLNNVKSHYTSAVTYMLKKFPIHDKEFSLKLFRTLSPQVFLTATIDDILLLLHKVPVKITESLLIEEVHLLKFDEKLSQWANNERIDLFWSKIFETRKENGEYKYIYFPQLVKAALCVSHGQGDVERGFSKSRLVLSKERTNMDQDTLHSILFVNSVIDNFYANKFESVVNDKNLLRLARAAYKNYEAYLESKKQEDAKKQEALLREEEKKRLKEEEKRIIQEERNTLKTIESRLDIMQKKENEARKVSNELLKEARQKLEKAVKEKNMIQANIAQKLLETAEATRSEADEMKNESAKLTKTLLKRKTNTLDNFLKKKQKTNL